LVLRIPYVIVLLGFLVPIGLSASGWVGLSLGRGPGEGGILMVGTLIFALLILWRLVVVASGRSRLDRPAASGALRVLRQFALVCLYVGAVVVLLDLFGRPLLRMIFRQPGDAGVMFYVVGVYLAVLKSIGLFGLLCLELGRLRSFEIASAASDS
jgi:hypothetical protein